MKKHHEISKAILIIPGILLLIGLAILLFGRESIAFFMVGVAIVAAILIHREEE